MKKINLNMIRITLLTFVVIILSIVGCQQNYQSSFKSDQVDKVLDLEGDWKFSIGDSKIWSKKDFNDKNWETIQVPSSWENQGFHGYDGFAWYRKNFKVSKDLLKNDLYLGLGYVDDTDETYLNGNLIGISGGMPPDYRTAYDANRFYFVPNEYFNPDGENILAVRVFDAELDGGILSGDIGLFTSKTGFQPDLNLSGIWQFQTGDSSQWSNENINSSGWNKIMVPAFWDVQGYADYDGFGWYRKSFYLPENYKGRGLILLVGQIDDIDQTYLNGVLVGSTGMWNFEEIPTSFNEREEYLQKRIYSVPEKVLKFGKINTIAVRVYDGFKDGGIYSGPIGLITQENYRKHLGRNR